MEATKILLLLEGGVPVGGGGRMIKQVFVSLNSRY